MRLFPNTLEGWRFVAIIFIILYLLTLCGCKQVGLRTDYKGGMHSANDGCVHKIGE